MKERKTLRPSKTQHSWGTGLKAGKDGSKTNVVSEVGGLRRNGVIGLQFF